MGPEADEHVAVSIENPFEWLLRLPTLPLLRDTLSTSVPGSASKLHITKPRGLLIHEVRILSSNGLDSIIVGGLKRLSGSTLDLGPLSRSDVLLD